MKPIGEEKRIRDEWKDSKQIKALKNKTRLLLLSYSKKKTVWETD